MNRRDALAALIALPEVARLASVPATSTDVIVVECDHPLSDRQVQCIQTSLASVWPGRKIVVFDKGLRLKLVDGAAT